MRATFATLCLASLTATGGAAQVVGDADVVEILLRDRGLPVMRDIDEYGDPRIRSQVDNTRFSVYFYECKPGPCNSIQFVAAFGPREKLGLRGLNVWNRNIRFAKTYADEAGNAVIEMDVSLSDDGIGRDNFHDLLDRWRQALAQFRRYFNR